MNAIAFAVSVVAFCIAIASAIAQAHYMRQLVAARRRSEAVLARRAVLSSTPSAPRLPSGDANQRGAA